MLVKTQDGVLGLFRHGLTRQSKYRHRVIVPCENIVTTSVTAEAGGVEEFPYTYMP